MERLDWLLATGLGCFVLLATGCSRKDDPHPASIDSFFGGSGGGTGGTGATGQPDAEPQDGSSAAGSGAGGSAGESGSAGAGATAGTGGSGEDLDASLEPDGPIYKDGALPDDTGSWDGGSCPDIDAVGTHGLTAGGATPVAFANAYNALAPNVAGGPLLIVLSGLSTQGQWFASFGPLTFAGGMAADFAAPPMTVGMDFNANLQVNVAMAEGAFDLIFDTSSTQATIPVAAVSLDGVLDNECANMTVSHLTLLIPTTAGNVLFDGTSLSALLGTPTATYGGGEQAWRVELSGAAQQVAYNNPKP